MTQTIAVERAHTEPSEWLFVNWIGFHGRSHDLAKGLPARAEFITGGSGSRFVRYARQWAETVALVRSRRPRVVFVMQPPVFALWAVRVAARRSTLIVADLHTGVFTDRKWSWAARGILTAMRRRNGAVIVTNESLARRCRARGARTFVLDDAVPRRVGDAPGEAASATLADLDPESYVLVPLAYASDEPLDEILDAARHDAGRTWVLTGKAPKHVRRSAPSNVVFSGYVSNDDYNWLMANSGAVLACTTEEDTMQRAGYEAVAWERPLVASRTRVLLDYFGDAVEFASPVADSLVDAIERTFIQRDEMQVRMVELGERRRAEHDRALRSLRDAVAAAESRRS